MELDLTNKYAYKTRAGARKAAGKMVPHEVVWTIIERAGGEHVIVALPSQDQLWMCGALAGTGKMYVFRA